MNSGVLTLQRVNVGVFIGRKINPHQPARAKESGVDWL